MATTAARIGENQGGVFVGGATSSRHCGEFDSGYKSKENPLDAGHCWAFDEGGSPIEGGDTGHFSGKPPYLDVIGPRWWSNRVFRLNDQMDNVCSMLVDAC